MLKRVESGALVATEDKEYLEILRRREDKKKTRALEERVERLETEMSAMREIVGNLMNV